MEDVYQDITEVIMLAIYNEIVRILGDWNTVIAEGQDGWKSGNTDKVIEIKPLHRTQASG